jgi:hypothetical protein
MVRALSIRSGNTGCLKAGSCALDYTRLALISVKEGELKMVSICRRASSRV